jgi:hypothetical protein
MGPQIPDGQPDYDSVDRDPLADFSAEPAAAPPDNPETPRDSPPAVPAEPALANSDLAVRLNRAERLLERTALEVSTLKSDLATLVSAVDDIKKRQSRRIERPLPSAAALPARLSRAGTAVAAVVLMVVGFALWGVYAVTSDDAPAPPSEGRPAEPVRQPAPITSPSAAPQIQSASAITAVTPPGDAPAHDAQARDAPAGNAPARDAPARDAPARATRLGTPASPAASRSSAPYVGTLTIDASPPGEVFLNRKSVGHTPLRLDKLRAGSHLIWIQREGHRRWTRVVAVAADKISRVSAELDPIAR